MNLSKRMDRKTCKIFYNKYAYWNTTHNLNRLVKLSNEYWNSPASLTYLGTRGWQLA